MVGPPKKIQEVEDLYRPTNKACRGFLSDFLVEFAYSDLKDLEYPDNAKVLGLDQYKYDPAKIAAAGLDEIRTTLTYYDRADYWIEGTGIFYVIDGRYLKTLQRLKELVTA